MAKQVTNPSGAKGIRITWRGIVVIAIIFVLGLFAVQNFQTAQVNLFGATLDIPVWLLVIAVFVLGVFLGGFVKGMTRKLRKPKPPKT